MTNVIPLFDGRRSRRPKPGPSTVVTAPPPPPSWLVAPEPELPRDPERAHRGANLCRALLPANSARAVLDEDDPVRDAALRRARTERRRPA